MSRHQLGDITPSQKSVDPLPDPEERRVLYAALDSFRQYRQAAHYNVTHLRRQSFYSLPSEHVDILTSPPFNLPATFRAVDDAIDSNADIAEAILEAGLQSVGIKASDRFWHGKATPNDMDKARSTLRQLYRDWSAEASQERLTCYEPIRAALEKHLPAVPVHQRHRYRLVVPGAGLGRLVLQLCAEGYTVEGNEISHHQLLASNYILNCTESAGQHRLFPWALSFSNHLSRANQLRSVEIPDVDPAIFLLQGPPSERHQSERFSMTAGDFCVVYHQAEYEAALDAVTTCFFIDTAPNVIHYIQTIKHCLKPDGIWINIGPLLWHFESAPTPAEKERLRRNSHSHSQTREGDVKSAHTGANNVTRGEPTSEGIGDPGSFELSNEEVISLVCRLGFEMMEQTERLPLPAGYIADPDSMMQTVYKPSFWVARKA